MITSQEKLQLRKIVEVYQQIADEIAAAEAEQEELHKRVDESTKKLQSNREKETEILEKLEKKYNKKFSIKDLIQFVYDNDQA